jgi:hypothetical protein
MLMCSGAIVSGSMALQFLDRASYPSADLDIYVSHVNIEATELWLLDHGMTKVPPPEGLDVMALDYASPPEILSVSDFRVPDSVRVIQLICTRRSPISAILGFHSCYSYSSRHYCTIGNLLDSHFQYQQSPNPQLPSFALDRPISAFPWCAVCTLFWVVFVVESSLLRITAQCMTSNIT